MKVSTVAREMTITINKCKMGSLETSSVLLATLLFNIASDVGTGRLLPVSIQLASWMYYSPTVTSHSYQAIIKARCLCPGQHVTLCVCRRLAVAEQEQGHLLPCRLSR
jgi:hypothetical protein